MNEINVGVLEQLASGYAKDSLTRRVHPFEVPIEAGDAEHVQRQREKLIDFLFSAAAFVSCLRQIGNAAPQFELGDGQTRQRLQRLVLWQSEVPRNVIQH